MRNLVVCADGTKCSPADQSNVYDLVDGYLTRDNSQVLYYDQGGHKLSEKLFGTDVRRRVKNCYQFLAREYRPGDKIFLFGFSRGAFVVRLVAGLIERVGLVRDLDNIPVAFAHYKMASISKEDLRDTSPVQHSHFYHKHAHVHFLGAYDTVEHVSPFTKEVLPDNVLHRNIPNAFHALAYHEHRKVFYPSIWDPSRIKPSRNVEQRWFPGVHGDIGGIYFDDSSAADNVLNWMLSKGKECGLKVNFPIEDKIPASRIKVHNNKHLGWKLLEYFLPYTYKIPEDRVIPKGTVVDETVVHHK